MASDKQNAANGRNAQRSTGPQTDEGKNKSKFNAVKHGLTAKLIDVLPDEDKAEFDKRLDGLRLRHGQMHRRSKSCS